MNVRKTRGASSCASGVKAPRPHLSWAWLAVGVSLALGGGSALAAAIEPEPVRHGFAPQPGLSIDQASRLLRGQVDGRPLSVIPLEGGRRGHQVRVLLDGGRVVTLHIDRDGRIRRSPRGPARMK